jgi:hypothetical protein
VPGGIFPSRLVRVTVTAFALVAGLAVVLSCGGSQQDSAKEEVSSEPFISAPTPSTNTWQMSRQETYGQDPQEHYEGLKMGEPAKFDNGLIVTLEGASLVQKISVPPLQLGAEDRLIAVRFDVENANPEGQTSPRSFNVTSALWQALDQNGNYLEKVFLPPETASAVGELPNSSPDHPYLGWQGQLMPGQKQQGTVVFVASPSAKEMMVTFTQPIMTPPFAEWELGAVSALPQTPY